MGIGRGLSSPANQNATCVAVLVQIASMDGSSILYCITRRGAGSSNERSKTKITLLSCAAISFGVCTVLVGAAPIIDEHTASDFFHFVSWDSPALFWWTAAHFW